MIETSHQVPPMLSSFTGTFYGLRSQGQFKILKGCNNYNSVLVILRLGLLVKEAPCLICFYLNLAIVKC